MNSKSVQPAANNISTSSSTTPQDKLYDEPYRNKPQHHSEKPDQDVSSQRCSYRDGAHKDQNSGRRETVGNSYQNQTQKSGQDSSSQRCAYRDGVHKDHYNSGRETAGIDSKQNNFETSRGVRGFGQQSDVPPRFARSGQHSRGGGQYNKDRMESGHYNRDGYQEGYNKGAGRYARDEQRGARADGRYNRPENQDRQDGRYNRTENQDRQDGRYNRTENQDRQDGRYNRPENQSRHDGRYNRPENQSGQDGRYNRSENQDRQDGRYNRSENQDRQDGRYNRPENQDRQNGRCNNAGQQGRNNRAGGGKTDSVYDAYSNPRPGAYPGPQHRPPLHEKSPYAGNFNKVQQDTLSSNRSKSSVYNSDENRNNTGRFQVESNSSESSLTRDYQHDQQSNNKHSGDVQNRLRGYPDQNSRTDGYVRQENVATNNKNSSQRFGGKESQDYHDSRGGGQPPRFSKRPENFDSHRQYNQNQHGNQGQLLPNPYSSHQVSLFKQS